MVANDYLAESLNVAKAILNQKKLTEPLQWAHKVLAKESPGQMKVFWWSDTIPLCEVPLFDLITRSQSGYMIVCGDRRLPPVLEYSSSGPTLSDQIDFLCAPALRQSGMQRETIRSHYASSTEIYLEFEGDDGAFHYLNVPNLYVLNTRRRVVIDRQPEQVFDSKIVDATWGTFTPGAPGDLPEIILQFFRPVRYQQNCDKYGALMTDCKIEFQLTQSYCAPNAIAGCVPVAWAMLMSSWKRAGFFGAQNIWANSTCWDKDWPSYGGWANPSQCPEVEKTIWKLHAMMGTTSEGGTFDNATLAGAGIFADYGLSWRFAQAQNQNFEFAISVIQHGQPLLWTANGIWSSLLAEQVSSPVPGGVGHGVVAYGYKKSDRTLYIALGWGSSYSDKYINYDQYRLTNCIYMTSNTLDVASTDILSVR